MTQCTIYQPLPSPLPNEIDTVRDHLSKGQAIRLWDVFAIGPAMIYFGVVADQVHPALRGFMIASGIGTVLYNGHNFLAVEREIQRRTDIINGGL